MTAAGLVLKQVRAGEGVPARVLIVVAHPDDETVGLGGTLPLLEAATILQLTDGAPDWPAAWTRAGCPDRAAYRALRGAEREAAWTAAGWTVPVVACDAPDQQAHLRLSALLAPLEVMLATVEVVWTHPYEGGHPDHDTAAWLVQTACDRLGARAPGRLEFASYHSNGLKRIAGDFWPCDWAAVRVAIPEERLAQKQRALAAYVSQASVLRWFTPAMERYRIAPRYDFTHPPPPPAVWYERLGWPTTGAQWRAAVARAS